MELESGVAGEFFLGSLWSLVLLSELGEPLGLAEKRARGRAVDREQRKDTMSGHIRKAEFNGNKNNKAVYKQQ